MLKSTVVTIAGALALSIASAAAQQAQPEAVQQESSIIGLPIYSSDGEKLGEVTQVGLHQGRQAVLAEMGSFLGMGATLVLIPQEMMTQQSDRLELPMTAEEVRSTISKP